MGIVTFLIVSSLAISIPLLTNRTAPHGIPDGELIPGTAATFLIDGVVNTAFGSYTPSQLDYTPSIKATEIKSNLANVDLQGMEIPQDVKRMLEQYGFALVDEGYDDIYQLYEDPQDAIPKFVTVDLCLHAYHVLYDITLRILEGESFFYDFEQMLLALRNAQILLNSTVSETVVHHAINKNIAYLSVMLYLLNDTNAIPSEVETLTKIDI